jgi:hypothetical protein
MRSVPGRAVVTKSFGTAAAPAMQPHPPAAMPPTITTSSTYPWDVTPRLRQVETAMGRERVQLLRACCSDEASWMQLGRQRKWDAKTAQSLVAEAIRALALHDQGQPVPAPPVPRARITLWRW